MPEPSRVLVVGGAVLDVKLRTAGPVVPGTSNPGAASTGVGGVGRNIAENLARLGTSVTLLAPVGADAAGEAVLERTRAAGVDCSHVVRTGHPTGTYTAVLDAAGDLAVAVADMRATDDLAVADLAPGAALVAAADLLVVDANPPAAVTRHLLHAARDAGVPVLLEPVSVAKATAVATVLGADAPLHTVTPNVDELAALVGHPVPGSRDTVLEAADELHARGVRRVWVRRGARGSLLSADESGARRAVVVAAPPTTVVDVTGAGDAMTAAYVHALLAGADTVEAVRAGQVAAALTCASAETVRSDLTAALVAEHLATLPTPTEETTR